MANPQERSDAGAKVTVACKLPGGLMMRGHAKRTERELLLGGGTRDFDIYRWNGEEVRIYGPSVPFGQSPKVPTIYGFAMTHNVSKDLWDNWHEANKDNPYVKNGLIFADESASRAQDRARGYEKAITGFEPIDPDDPGKKVKGISKADRK